MDPVSRTGRLLHAARLQAWAKQRSPVPPAEDTAASSLPPSAATHVLQRIAAIEPGEPERRSRVMRAFLEGSLLDTFGTKALMDPAFQHVVDDVHDTMRADAKLAAATDRLVDRLLEGLESGRARTELEAAFRRQPDGLP